MLRGLQLLNLLNGIMETKKFNMDWINIKDKTPGEGEICLAVCAGKVKYCKFRDGRFYRETDIASGDRIINFFWSNVELWMPLPKVP